MADAPGPSFLLIGAARSGTTVLARLLATHPQVSLTEPKETHFLALSGVRPAFTGPGDDETINRAAITDRDRWMDLFRNMDGVARGEGSVSTLYYPEQSIPNIDRYCPSVKMIVILRDPVERAFSAYQYQVSRGYEDLSFGEALNDEASRIERGWHHMWHYASMGAYDRQLAPFRDHFGNDRLLLLDHDDLVIDPAGVLARCQAFIGVEVRPPTSEAHQQVNASGSPRSVTVARAIKLARGVEPLRRVLVRTVPFQWRERIRASNLRHDEMATDDRIRLAEHFAPTRTRLAEMLGDQAPRWARPAKG